MKTQIVKLLLTAILPLTLISCRVVNGDVTALMRPPRPPGEYYEIQKALEKYVKATVYLKYPKSGDNRSAFIVRDLDGDGVKNEAIAFYSLVADGSTLHMNIIGKDVSDWNSLADIDLKASDIERADFADMTGQGCENIVVGLKMFTSLARQIRVLSFQGRKLTESLAENYTEYALADLDGDSLKELLLVSLNTAEPATSIARMVKLNGTEVIDFGDNGKAPIDGNVTGYAQVSSGVVHDGRYGVYLDGYKANDSMNTDLLYWYDPASDSGSNAALSPPHLLNPFYDVEKQTTVMTLRASIVTSRDINSDGKIEIPMITPLLGFEDVPKADQVMLTKWRQLNGKNFDPVFTAVMNYTDGYSVRFDTEWQAGVTATRNTATRSRSFYEWNAETHSRGRELLNIRIFTENEWWASSSPHDEYFRLVQLEGAGLIYAARLGDSQSPLFKTEPEVMDMVAKIN